MHEVVPGFRSTVLAVPRISARGFVSTMLIDDADRANEWRFAIVMVHNGTEATRIEFREEEALAEAIASFDGLTADVRAEGPGAPTGAQHAADQLSSSVTAGDWEVVTDGLRDDFLLQSSRKFGPPDLDRDAFVATLKDVYEVFGAP